MEGKNIIIKKVKKKGHAGGHGGSWKVAYADFVTAMMAFFLLMWLITMVAPDKRARVSSYFKHFSIFDKGGSSMLDLNKKTPMVTIIDQDNPESSNPPSGGNPDTQDPGKAGSGPYDASQPRAKLENKLKQEVQSKLADVKDQVLISSFEGGVRIEIIDKDGNPLFPLASTELTANGKKILKVIAENVKDSDSRIALEGHTDALSYTAGGYSNWELSTGRASAARKELERDGIVLDHLLRVAGYAATQPLVKENPNDPRNRRISILLFDRFEYGDPSASSPTAAQARSLPKSDQMLRGVPVEIKAIPQPAPPPQRPDPLQEYLFKR